MRTEEELKHVPTHERTEAELERAFEAYIRSKTVNGRFCPTPELCHDSSTGSNDGDVCSPTRVQFENPSSVSRRRPRRRRRRKRAP